MKPIKNPDKPTKNEEKELHFNARAKNSLFESSDEHIFNQVSTLDTSHEIWLKLHELRDGTSNVCEQKHCLAKQNYDSFNMKDDELVCDMCYSLNLIINELKSIGITKLDDADIVRKIINILPQKKYGTFVTILHNLEDLSKMTPAIVIGKIVAFEMSRKMGQDEASSSSKKECSHKLCGQEDEGQESWIKLKLKLLKWWRIKDEEYGDDDQEESSDDASSSSTSKLDEESIKIIKKVEKMIRRLNVNGVPIQIEDCIFSNQRRESKERMDAMDMASWDTLLKFAQTSPYPRQRRRRRRRARTKPSPP